MINKNTMLKNVERITKEIIQFNPDAKLVTVTKTQPIEIIRILYDAGYRDFGENRVEQFVARQALFPDARWHFIGRLSRKNVAKVIGKTELIHSVGSLELLNKIERSCEAAGGIEQRVLLQVNVSGEEVKQGFEPGELPDIASKKCLDDFKWVKIEGLMTMAPFTSEGAVQRSCFTGLCKLRNEMNTSFNPGWNELSMGMSNDYQIALREGATMVRVGTALFES